jgi:hypothetical protein
MPKYIFALIAVVSFTLTPVAAEQCSPGSHIYKDNRDGTVTDKCTKIIWQQATNSTDLQFSDADSYCTNLSLAKYSDWRLPTIDELLTIVDYTLFSPAADPILQIPPHDPNTGYDPVLWSSTPNQYGSRPLVWGVDFFLGSTVSSMPTTNGSVALAKCVRSKRSD